MSNKRPLPDVIYTRRRVAAIVVVLVVLALILLLFNLLGGNNKDTDPAAETTTSQTTELSLTSEPSTTTQTSTATTVTETTTTNGTSTGPTTTTSNAAANKRTCELKDLEITASTDQPNYTGDQRPEFFINIHNPTGADCDINLGDNPVAFEVYNLATNERVWSDIDCNESVGRGTETFAKGEDRSYSAVWSRTNSGPNRCDDRQPVQPGSYYLHTLVGSNHSNPVPFNIR